MDFYELQKFKEIYNTDNTVEQKIEEVRKMFPGKDILVEDLQEFFSYTVSQLPIVKGIMVETKFGGSDDGCNYVGITQYPDRILPDVQKTIMRILGCTGGFTCEKWAIGSPNETIQKHLNEYLKTHPGMMPVGQKKHGYPKVFQFDSDKVDEAPNESYIVWDVIGFVMD